MKCVICDRESGASNYCSIHARAYQDIVKNYDQWKKGLEISWKEYLSEIAKNPLTGEWAKETAQHLMKTGEQIDVKNG